MNHKSRSLRTACRRALAGAIVTVGVAVAPAHAQVATATLKGSIVAGQQAVAAGTEVVATNVANGYSYRTTTRADGSYVLPGLPPGTYTIAVAGTPGKSAPVVLRVGETASLDFGVAGAAGAAPAGAEGATTLADVTVIGSVFRAAVKTSEIGTSITPEQIENLPQASRNVLAFADLAPGVRFDTSQSTGQVRLQAGSQNQDNVNLFIDGVSQKNFVLRGGIAGMDSTRGNPFPQSAISEYRVITQNYKAEYDSVSSVAITAVTKSGTNEFHGDAFYDRVDDSFVAYSPFQNDAKAQGVERPPFHQDQYGLTLGGPILEDRMHFFVAYEGKKILQPRQVTLQNDNLLPNAGIVPQLRALQGSTDAEFKEHLGLAKLDWRLTDDQKLELSARLRREDDYVPEDNRLSAPGNDKDRVNDETRVDLKHTWALGEWLNEARIGYQKTLWNPRSDSSDPMIRFQVSPNNQANNVVDVLIVGGSPDAQKREQKGVSLQEDLTYTGREGHTIKMGVKAEMLTFDLSGTAFSVPKLYQMIDNVTGLPTTIRTEPAVPAAGANFDNTHFGIYLQDDWQVTELLELNLGLRWDYETNMLNNNYVTPADRVAALLGPDGPRYGITPPPGQTYEQSLALGGVNIRDFIADGNGRKPFKTAIQPRLGFSYDLSGGDKTTVVFGGAGRAYDRTMANHALDELQKNKQPGGEIWLIRNNDAKQPYTDQFSLGLRQAIYDWNTELGATLQKSHDQFNWYGGNRDANGGWATQSPIDPLWGGPPGYGTLILGDFITKAKTSTVYAKADKPFTTESGWGATATYTYSSGKTTNRQWTNDIFNWTFGKPGQGGWNPSVDVEKHRFVGTFMTDRLPFGTMLSLKGTFGSGKPYQVTSCAAGWDACVFREGDGGRFSQIDLALSKTFDVSITKLTVRADVLNVFNTINYTQYEGWGGGPGNPQNVYGGDNPNVGQPHDIDGPMRTLKLTFSAAF